jgi:hypothetical protein
MSWLEAKLRQIAQRHRRPLPESVKPKPRYRLSKDAVSKPVAEPPPRPADISPSEWRLILMRPPCTLSEAELTRNDRVFERALEAAARLPAEPIVPVAAWSLPTPGRFWK